MRNLFITTFIPFFRFCDKGKTFIFVVTTITDNAFVNGWKKYNLQIDDQQLCLHHPPPTTIYVPPYKKRLMRITYGFL